MTYNRNYSKTTRPPILASELQGATGTHKRALVPLSSTKRSRRSKLRVIFLGRTRAGKERERARRSRWHRRLHLDKPGSPYVKENGFLGRFRGVLRLVLPKHAKGPSRAPVRCRREGDQGDRNARAIDLHSLFFETRRKKAPTRRSERQGNWGLVVVCFRGPLGP